jgi:hypothetical protein
MNENQNQSYGSSFVTGQTALGCYDLTILVNPEGVNEIRHGNRPFVRNLVSKMLFEVDKIEDNRDKWSGHDFNPDESHIEVKALRGWAYIFNVTMTRETVNCLKDGDIPTHQILVDYLTKAADNLDRRFPLNFKDSTEMPTEQKIIKPELVIEGSNISTVADEILPPLSVIEEASTVKKPKRVRKTKKAVETPLD